MELFEGDNFSGQCVELCDDCPFLQARGLTKNCVNSLKVYGDGAYVSLQRGMVKSLIEPAQGTQEGLTCGRVISVKFEMTYVSLTTFLKGQFTINYYFLKMYSIIGILSFIKRRL